MQLKINNIGKIKSATFEFNGITVIAGNNNTGKSTVGKVLFALFSKFNNINKSIEQYKNEAIIARVFKALSLYQSDEKSILSLLSIFLSCNLSKYSSTFEIILSLSKFPETTTKILSFVYLSL